ncbi:hypothetical protein NDU88_005813 [Pleurodeles waltl]|uniref:Uncharacterized protein n=1 Tax=Pleurodeles waltl TaxID=8319 RepID=A0AAV7NNW1_PLEWA|nr:hypothetical protein NDU88_005813 [Pleurodeles waltl]
MLYWTPASQHYLEETLMPSTNAGTLGPQTAKGHALLAQSRRDFVVAAPTHPTHYPGATWQKLDILDIVVVKNLSQSMELETLTALTSDHNPVLITVGDKIECQQQGARYNYKNADWILDPIRYIKDIDQAVDRFTDAVHTAIKGNIPQQKPQSCSIYDLPSGIKHSVSEKNRARRQWHPRPAEEVQHVEKKFENTHKPAQR